MDIVAFDGTGGCYGGSCPTVYATDSGSFVVQGYDAEALLTAEGRTLPTGELAVEIPRNVVEMLVKKFA